MAAPQHPPRLRVIIFSAMRHEITAFQRQLSLTPDARQLDLVYVSSILDINTSIIAAGAQAICLFATDYVDSYLLDQLHTLGVRLIALRYPGVSSVDIEKAADLGIAVSRIPGHAYTSIAEYTVTLMLSLNRKVHLASNKVRDGNMSLQGLVGFEMAGTTVGVIGTGKVGKSVARILHGFGCNILAYDIALNQEVIDMGAKYVSMATLLARSDIITLHAPLTPGTHHLIDRDTLARCKTGVYIVNTSRGGLIDIPAAIEALKSGQIGALAIDVYEGEANLFFKDHTGEPVDDDFQLLRSMPNVLITGHQSTLTINAIREVAKASVKTLLQFRNGQELDHVVKPQR